MEPKRVKIHCPVCDHITAEIVVNGKYSIRLRCQKCKEILLVEGDVGKINIVYSAEEAKVK